MTKPKKKPKVSSASQISDAVLNGGNFRKFASLKSGRDKFSSMKEDSLFTALGETACMVLKERVIAQGKMYLDPGKVLRWFLRAREATPEATLDQLIEFAIHKCAVDAEIGKNAAQTKSEIPDWLAFEYLTGGIK